MGYRSIPLNEILSLLKVNELSDLCYFYDIVTGSKKKADLINAILGIKKKKEKKATEKCKEK